MDGGENGCRNNATKGKERTALIAEKKKDGGGNGCRNDATKGKDVKGDGMEGGAEREERKRDIKGGCKGGGWHPPGKEERQKFGRYKQRSRRAIVLP